MKAPMVLSDYNTEDNINVIFGLFKDNKGYLRVTDACGNLIIDELYTKDDMKEIAFSILRNLTKGIR